MVDLERRVKTGRGTFEGIYLIYLIAIRLAPGGSSKVHIYTKIIHRTTQLTTLVGRLSVFRTKSGQTNLEECGPCPVFASFTLALLLQLWKRHGKTSVFDWKWSWV